MSKKSVSPLGEQITHETLLWSRGSSHTGRDICGHSRRNTRTDRQDKTNLSHDGLNPAHVPCQWVNNPTLGEFCFAMIGRADIKGSKSDIATNAWPPQASYPWGNFSDTFRWNGALKALTVSLGRSYAWSICSMFSLCMESNALEKSTNNSAASRFLPKFLW